MDTAGNYMCPLAHMYFDKLALVTFLINSFDNFEFTSKWEN